MLSVIICHLYRISDDEIKEDKMDGTCRTLEGIEKLRCPKFPRPESAADLTMLYALASQTNLATYFQPSGW
jgi:hypothetical protein